MDIPKEIKYEFFLIFMGLIILIFPTWLYLFQTEKFLMLFNPNKDISFISLGFLLGIGVFLFLLGFTELTENYFRRKELDRKKDFIENYKLNQIIKEIKNKSKKDLPVIVKKENKIIKFLRVLIYS